MNHKYFQVVLNGYSSTWSAWLETHTSKGPRVLAGSEGSVLEPSAGELTALNVGTAVLKVRTSDNDTEFLRARLPQVIIAFVTNILVCMLLIMLMLLII